MILIISENTDYTTDKVDCPLIYLINILSGNLHYNDRILKFE